MSHFSHKPQNGSPAKTAAARASSRRPKARNLPKAGLGGPLPARAEPPLPPQEQSPPPPGAESPLPPKAKAPLPPKAEAAPPPEVVKDLAPGTQGILPLLPPDGPPPPAGADQPWPDEGLLPGDEDDFWLPDDWDEAWPPDELDGLDGQDNFDDSDGSEGGWPPVMPAGPTLPKLSPALPLVPEMPPLPPLPDLPDGTGGFGDETAPGQDGQDGQDGHDEPSKPAKPAKPSKPAKLVKLRRPPPPKSSGERREGGERPQGWPTALRMCDLQLGDRPRERMLQHGPATLSDAETLALVLGTGLRGLSALDLARSLLAEYGELRSLLRLGDAELLKVPGLGEAKIARLRASVELGRRYLTVPPQRGQALGNTSDVRTYLMQRFRDQPHEVFCCLFLDTRSRILAFEEMFQGSLDSAQVYIREVVRRAMDLNARSVIAVHNHPSGVADPSGSDKRLTRRMSEALSLVDVRLTDHLIVGEGQVRSMAESGLM